MVPYEGRFKDYLWELGYSTADFGTDSEESVDYPTLASRWQKGQWGFSWVFYLWTDLDGDSGQQGTGHMAALCTDTFMARCSREHNHANILVLGERVIGLGLARDIVKTWLETEPGGGRHQRRVEKIRAIEEGCGGDGGLV